VLAVVLALGATLAGCAAGSDEGPGAATMSTTRAIRVGNASTGSAAPSSHPRGAVEDCSSRSSADFNGAFADPANLVVGPLLLVGAGTPTAAAVVEAYGGQKFPLLVKAGHIVTVQVPASARRYAALGYGPLPQGEVDFRDGHDTVTFFACGSETASGSSADGPVTFWSGFVLAREPSCVPLDVYVDDKPARRRVELELGRPC
jgi:hypothetical protein